MRYPDDLKWKLDDYLKSDIDVIVKFDTTLSVNFKGDLLNFEVDLKRSIFISFILFIKDDDCTSGEPKILKSYFDFLQQAYFEEHKFSSIFHTVIKCQTTSKEVLNYPTRIIENLVEEKVQCGKYI